MEEIRLLGKEDIEVRVAQTNTYNGGQTVKVNLLLYKNARVDMKILDELFGPMGWKRSHKMIGDRLYCQVEVWDEAKKEWISKEDVGVESNTEAEKGQASDSFKRACVNWGIGRELYTSPKIVVELNDREYTKGQDGRIKVWATFSVGEIGYDVKTRTVKDLTIVDRFGNVRYKMGGAPEREEDPAPAPAVSARRTSKAKAVQEAKPKEPMSREDYFKIVKAYAEGRKTKTGGDYKQTWITMTNATPEMIKTFDQDVADFKMSNC